MQLNPQLPQLCNCFPIRFFFFLPGVRLYLTPHPWPNRGMSASGSAAAGGVFSAPPSPPLLSSPPPPRCSHANACSSPLFTCKRLPLMENMSVTAPEELKPFEIEVRMNLPHSSVKTRFPYFNSTSLKIKVYFLFTHRHVCTEELLESCTPTSLFWRKTHSDTSRWSVRTHRSYFPRQSVRSFGATRCCCPPPLPSL